MKRSILIMFLAAAAAAAQPHYSLVLGDLEEGSPLLHSARRHCEAEKAAVYVEPLFAPPEVEGAYYWGAPVAVGRRWDLSATQSFEMPSVTARRVRLRKIEEQAAEGDYRLVRNRLLYEAQQLCAEVVYWRAVAKVCDERLALSVRLSEAYGKRFAAGDCTVLEYNRVRLELADSRQAAEAASLSLSELLGQLRLLVGKDDYVFEQSVYEPPTLPGSFEQWYAQQELLNPELGRLSLSVDLARQEHSLTRSRWLPEVTVGYASENTWGEAFRGVKMGVSLPLWNRGRAVAHARMAEAAAQSEFDSQRLAVAGRMRMLFERVVSLSARLESFRTSFDGLSTLPLLNKALEGGEITLEQYLLQVDSYSRFQMQIWALARDCELAWLQLNSISL